MNIILFGPPGAGKGTQADTLVKNFDLLKISTGDLLRDEVSKKTEIGLVIKSKIDAGLLVSDKIINDLIVKILSRKDCFNRLIFDGYPRNLNQANALKELLNKYDQKIDLVLKLSVSLETITKRIVERQALEKRDDDSAEIAIKRYKTYEISTEPMIEYYKKLNLLKVIDGERPIDQINKEISDITSLI